MAFQLADIVPWGRSFDEYVRIFSLSNDDLALRIIGCGDGPASFNAVAAARGMQVVSVDPLYRFSRLEIETRIDATRRQILEQTRANHDQFVWDDFRTLDELDHARTEAMALFLEDYDAGRAAGRYIDAELPQLPFPDDRFDLALCSHFLFLYDDHYSLPAHVAAMREMCRVAREARIFPLVSLNGEESGYLGDAAESLRLHGMSVELRRVDYEFQRGANQMMVVKPFKH